MFHVDEKEITASDPGPPTEVEAGLAQDVTLESELWTFDEVEWHETAQDTTTIKYVPVQVRPAVATEETGQQQVRAWKLFLRSPETIPTNVRSPEEHETKNPTAATDKLNQRTIQPIKSGDR